VVRVELTTARTSYLVASPQLVSQCRYCNKLRNVSGQQVADK